MPLVELGAVKMSAEGKGGAFVSLEIVTVDAFAAPERANSANVLAIRVELERGFIVALRRLF
jgi:hypothetical protein